MATVTLPDAEVKETKTSNKQTSTKYVYFFGGGKADVAEKRQPTRSRLKHSQAIKRSSLP